MAKSKPRRSAFVPRLLVRGAAIVSVVPACAIAACGSDSPGTVGDGGGDSALLGVADVGYTPRETGAPDARPDALFTVASVAYPAYESGAPDARPDAPDGADSAPDVTSRPDVIFSVAYPAYEAGRG